MNQIEKKISLIIFFIVLVFLILICRIFYLTIIKYNKNLNTSTFYDPIYRRVDIVDKNNTIIASNIKVKTLYLNKVLIENEKFIADKLSKILKLDYNFVYNKITTPTKTKYILIKNNIFPEEEFKIRQLPIASLVFEEDLLRFYPHNNLFSHILGYVDADKNGVTGIEEYYDDYLKKTENKPLKLTLDLRIQEVVREELSNAITQYNANFAVGIITEVKTGNVLAIVSLPDYNPNKIDNLENTFNHATYGNYELGSVFKIFTFANGIETNVINKDTMFDVSKKLKHGNFIIKDIDSIMRKKTINTKQGFTNSSNLVAVQIAKKIGIDRQVDFFDKLGLLDKLNIDINQKTLPLQPRIWKEINLLTIAYGYGIAVSPLHVISATNGILNNGILVTPRFSYYFNGQTTKNVVSKNTSIVIRNLFRNVVLDGTGKLAYIDDINIGGKTGTARKNSTSGGYNEGEHIASFVSAFPIDNPKYSTIIVIDKPKINGQGGTGGTVATEITKQIILKILPFLDNLYDE